MSIINGTNGSDVITGTTNSDVINAGNGNDTVYGGTGADIIDAGNGNDTVDAGAGNDIVNGGNGNDVLNGGSDADIVNGGNGNDTIDGGSNSDVVTGGNGNDLLIYNASENVSAVDIYDGSNGQDTLRLVVNQSLAGSAAFQADIAQLEALLALGSASYAFNSIDLVVSSIERLEIVVDGGGNAAPTDIALSNATVAENAPGAVIGTLSTTDPNAGDTHTYTVSDSRFEVVGSTLQLRPGQSLDYEAEASVSLDITATDAGGLTRTETFIITVTDVQGNTIVGTAAGETLVGTTENDTIQALGGDDLLIGGDGPDVLDGGAGVDRVSYTSATGPLTVNMAAGTASAAGAGSDTLIAIESVRGTNFDDFYDATGFNAASQPIPGTATSFNEFEGMGGNDTIVGNDNTRISYLNAAAAVTVDALIGAAQGTAAGDAAGVGLDTFSGVSSIRGSNFNDTLLGNNNSVSVSENFEGRGGNDLIDGRGGFDRAIYTYDAATTSGITVNLAAGSVVGDATIGTDTLLSIEAVRGTDFADVLDATGFSATSTNAGSSGATNEFEGAGGDDTITGNGATRISYVTATAGVTVDLDLGTAFGTDAGDLAGVGVDTFTGPTINTLKFGIQQVRGSTFNDVLLGSNNSTTVAAEFFDGMQGDDFIDGRGGFDVARYDPIFPGQPFGTLGITVNMAAGTVTGRDALSLSLVGTDTLRSIESVRGTSGEDLYDATGFSGSSQNAGSSGTFNEFEGMGGNDTITGNGSTRITYLSATEGVTVDLSTGTVTGGASVGTDTILGGVNAVRGTNFDDTIIGGAGAETLEGRDGNDSISGNGANDRLIGGGGNDTIDGGGGFDIAQFTGAIAQYSITPGGFPGTSTVTDTVAGRDGVDNLTTVELLEFADAFQMNARNLNINNIGLTAGKPIFGTNLSDPSNPSVGDNLTVGINASGRFIDLRGGGADTLTLAVSGLYVFNLANVENLVGSGGADTVALQNLANGLNVDLGGGTDALNLIQSSNVTIRNVEEVHGGAGFDTVNLGSASAVTVNSVETVNGSAGDDQVTVAADFSVTTVNATFNLGGGTNSVVLNFFGPGSTANLGLTDVASLGTTGGVETINLLNAASGLDIEFGGVGVFNTLNLGNGDNTATVHNAEFINAFGGGNDTVTGYLDTSIVNQSINLGTGIDTFTLAGASGSYSLFVSGALTFVGATAADEEHINLLNEQLGSTFDLGAGLNDSLQLSSDGTLVNDVTVRNIENVQGSFYSDHITIANTSGITTVTGGVDSDFIWASVSEDRLRYSSIFESRQGEGVDQVIGFDADADKFVFDGIAFQGNALNFIGTDVAFSGNGPGNPAPTAEARLSTYPGGAILQIDVDGDGFIGANDMEINLTGLTGTLDNQDFLLI